MSTATHLWVYKMSIHNIKSNSIKIFLSSMNIVNRTASGNASKTSKITEQIITPN